MAQQIINLGTSANAGDGDNLRSAMDKTNDNFTEVYTAGPVGSNITISNNSITSTNTNGNISLATDGTGVIQFTNNFIPDTNDLRYIGSANNRPKGIYVGTAGLIADGPVNMPTFANATVRDSTITAPATGMIVVTGNVYQGYIGSAWTALAGSDGISAVADDTSPQLGGNLSLASFNIDGTGSINIAGAVTASANVTGAYLIGNGSQLTDVSASSATTAGTVTTAAQPNITSVGTLTSVSVTGNITVGGLVDGRDVAADGALAASAVQPGDNISDLTNNSNFIDLTALSVTTLSASGDGALVYNTGNGVFQFTPADAGSSNYGDANVATYLGSNFGSNVIVTTGNITASNLIGEVTGNVTGDLTGDVTGDVTGNVSGSAATATTAGTVTANAQPNITSVGTLTSVTVTGNVDAGNVNATNVTGDLTGNVTGDLTGNVTGDVTGDLTGDVTGNITSTGTSTFTTVDINGGAVDGVVIGANSAAAGNFTTIDTTGNATVGGNLTVNVATKFEGNATFDTGTEEAFDTLTGSTGTVTHDCNNGHVFYHTGASGDITANFTNLGLTAEFATNLTVIINQGATPYEVTAVQIGGAAQTINWQGGSQPTGNANGIDAFSFTILNDGGTYVVLGQMVDFT